MNIKLYHFLLTVSILFQLSCGVGDYKIKLHNGFVLWRSSSSIRGIANDQNRNVVGLYILRLGNKDDFYFGEFKKKKTDDQVYFFTLETKGGVKEIFSNYDYWAAKLRDKGIEEPISLSKVSKLYRPKR